MSRGKQGSKAGRRERHLAHQQFLKKAKRLRKQRAKAHAALGGAARMQRSRRKGMANLDANMEALGYKRRTRMASGDYAHPVTGGDVLAKWEATT
jgi:hypothetical protein